ncbi:MAG: hypothetical protein AAGD07_22000, partial [Planctomycetota bacterium]
MPTLRVATREPDGGETAAFLGLQEVDAPSPSDVSVQGASLADRDVQAVGYDEFHARTELPAVSPQRSLAKENDLVVSVSGFIDAGPVEAVVLKPRHKAGVYKIPAAPRGNAYEFLKTHLKEASRSGVGRILFPADSVFEIDPPLIGGTAGTESAEYAAHLVIREMEDVTIDLNGSTLRYLKADRGITIRDSRRIALRNGTIEGSGLLVSVAEITPDDSPAGFRLDILPEYRAQIANEYGSDPPPLITVGAAQKNEAGQWRIARDDYAEIFTNRRNRPFNQFDYDNGSFIATTETSREGGTFAPGTTHVWLLHQNNAGNAIHLDNEDHLENITLEDIKLVNIPGMGIAGEVNRGLHVRNVEFALSDDRHSVFSLSSDGIHINANA